MGSSSQGLISVLAQINSPIHLLMKINGHFLLYKKALIEI
jgi:hypothetical protein